MECMPSRLYYLLTKSVYYNIIMMIMPIYVKDLNILRNLKIYQKFVNLSYLINLKYLAIIDCTNWY